MEDLLELAFADPAAAEREAKRILERQTADPLRSSYARQCLGIVLRERGQLREAIRHLQAGLREVRSAQFDERARDLRATLGVTLAMAGRTRSDRAPRGGGL